MKIFTIRNGKIEYGAKVEKIDTPNGYKINAITVGNRYIMVSKYVDIVKHVILNRTNGGVLRFLPKNDLNNNKCVIVIKSGNGFRAIDKVCIQKNSDKSLFQGRILMQGDFKNGKQFIVEIKKDIWFRIKYAEELYDEPSEHCYTFDGNTINLYSAEEYGKHLNTIK